MLKFIGSQMSGIRGNLEKKPRTNKTTKPKTPGLHFAQANTHKHKQTWKQTGCQTRCLLPTVALHESKVVKAPGQTISPVTPYFKINHCLSQRGRAGAHICPVLQEGRDELTHWLPARPLPGGQVCSVTLGKVIRAAEKLREMTGIPHCLRQEGSLLPSTGSSAGSGSKRTSATAS